MRVTNRQFSKRAVALGIGAAMLTAPCGGFLRAAHAFNQSPQIPLFKTTLRGAGPGGIPVALPDSDPAPVTGVTHYTIGINQFDDQITPTSTGLGPTALWGYVPAFGLGGNTTPTHLGGIIIGNKNVPIQITFQNHLDGLTQHIIPVDTTPMGSSQTINKTAIHLHGGLIPWVSDGGPFDYFEPAGGAHGDSFLNNQTFNPNNSPDSGKAEYYYPLNQSARFLWYHDHAHGITRVNAYAGLATALLVRDQFEKSLVATKGLPDYIENPNGHEIPLIFQDKIFVDANIGMNDPGWGSMVQGLASRPGSLWYAHTYEPNQLDGTGRWDLGPTSTPPPDPSAIPEFFGDTMLVNGTTFPEASVEPRRYRLRMLNACNARFLNLQLYLADETKNPDGSLKYPDGIVLDTDPTSPTYGTPKNAPFINNATNGAFWLQIGTEGGFLSKPAKVPSNVPFVIKDLAYLAGGPALNPALVKKSLLVSPAERPDLIVDFKLAAGKQVILYNDAAAPFPSGDDRNDYFPKFNTNGADGTPQTAGLGGIGNPVNGTTQPGNGPNTRVLMRFTVGQNTTAPADKPLAINDQTNLADGIDPTLLPSWGFTNQAKLTFPKRMLTLNEYFDDRGRLVQIIGNAEAPFGSPYDGSGSYINYGLGGATPTANIGATVENVNQGDTEVWEIYNTTGDVHPMHFHLVNVQVINRQRINLDSQPYNTVGAITPPDANERGWKETVSCYPGTVTRVVMKWDLSTIVDKNLVPIDNSTQTLVPGQLPITKGQPVLSTRVDPADPSHEYVWHCHILEHEEHDMMHTISVHPKPPLLPKLP